MDWGLFWGWISGMLRFPIHFYRVTDICRFVVSPNLSKKQKGEKNE